jgi:hypothetical protein
MAQQFDDDVRRALEKWPDVPACYGWLGLGRRGDWLIKGAAVTHRRAVEFLSRNYARDHKGRYFVLNGPQRAYCDLAYTPWLYRMDGRDRLLTHTAKHAVDLTAMIVDETGDLLLDSEHGIGLLDDRDLERFITCVEASGSNREDYGDLTALLCDLSTDDTAFVTLAWAAKKVPVRSMERARVAGFYAFDPSPRA